MYSLCAISIIALIVTLYALALIVDLYYISYRVFDFDFDFDLSHRKTTPVNTDLSLTDMALNSIKRKHSSIIVNIRHNTTNQDKSSAKSNAIHIKVAINLINDFNDSVTVLSFIRLTNRHLDE